MDNILNNWKKYYRLNNYYHKWIEKIAADLIPDFVSVVEFGSKTGEILSKLKNKDKTYVEFETQFVDVLKKKYKSSAFSYIDFIKKNKKYDYILMPHGLSEIQNIQNFLEKIKKHTNENTKIIVFHFNYFWKPLLDLASKLRLKNPSISEPNWLSQEDIDNFFYLEGFDKVKQGARFIIPYRIPIISEFVNKYISTLPIFTLLSLIKFAVYKTPSVTRDYSVSIVIPARNEAGHMKGVLKKIPKFAKKQEIIFVEGHSTDDTIRVIKDEIKVNKNTKAFLYKQKGKGKGDAVRLGFSKCKNEILMILDADLTVDPIELPKFYNAIKFDKAEFVMGSRLVYPMEKQAMRTLNVLGNKFFSWAFSFLLDQRIKDTLCGTKVLLRSNYLRIAQNRKLFGDFDPFGDYDLIFGASKLNLKILEIPIRYKERVYGKTNISRFRHGLLLLSMVIFAAKKIKFI